MKANIKFILKIFLTLCIAVAILSVGNKLYSNSSTYQGVSAYKNMPDKIELANFGPSYGKSCFDYSDYKKDNIGCFNFSLSGQELNHDYGLYKTYEDKISDDATVAIAISYFCFTNDNIADSPSRYYRILNSEYINGFSAENWFYANCMPVYGQGGALTRNILLSKISVIKADGKDESAKKESLKEKLSTDSKDRIIKVTNQYYIPNEKYIETNEQLLIKWVNELKERGCTPILVLTPYYTDYANGFSGEQFDKCFTQPLNRVIEATGVTYVDFNKEYEYYTHETEFFSNCDHVSKEGKAEFMKLYSEYLKENNLLK